MWWSVIRPDVNTSEICVQTATQYEVSAVLGETSRQLTSSASSTMVDRGRGDAEAGEAAAADDASSSEQSFLTAGDDAPCIPTSASSGLFFIFLGVFVAIVSSAADAIEQGTDAAAGMGVAWREDAAPAPATTVAVAAEEALFFLVGLPPSAPLPVVGLNNKDADDGDRGDLVTLASRTPRARLFVGVAVLIVGFEGRGEGGGRREG